jgi:hypothetical protein
LGRTVELNQRRLNDPVGDHSRVFDKQPVALYPERMEIDFSNIHHAQTPANLAKP